MAADGSGGRVADEPGGPPSASPYKSQHSLRGTLSAARESVHEGLSKLSTGAKKARIATAHYATRVADGTDGHRLHPVGLLARTDDALVKYTYQACSAPYTGSALFDTHVVSLISIGPHSNRRPIWLNCTEISMQHTGN